MPKLARNVRLDLIEPIFEFRVSLAHQCVESWSIIDVIEVEWLTGCENSRMLGEVSIIRVIETVYRYNVSF